MERNRDMRRGGGVAVNGGGSNGMSRRRLRRESPEEEGGLDMGGETMRLRERKKEHHRERERDRSSRSKRRRGERMSLHGGRDDGDETSEESVGDEDDEDEDGSVSLPPPPPPPRSSYGASSAMSYSLTASPAIQSQTQNHSNHHHYHHHSHHHHHQQSPSQQHIHHGNNNHGSSHHHQQQQQHQLLLLQQQQKKNSYVRTPSPSPWKADEMIGVPIPRKARSASAKRSSQEWQSAGGISGAGGNIGSVAGDSSLQIQRQPSASPSRVSPTSASPSSSNASIRKKMKPIGGTKPRQLMKSSSFVQEEIEVAEVLFGLTQIGIQLAPPKPEQDPDSKSQDSSASPTPHLPPPPHSATRDSSSLPVIAPKRKRPRLIKCDEEVRAAKVDADPAVTTKSECLPPTSEKKTEPFSLENDASLPTTEGAADPSKKLERRDAPVADSSIPKQKDSDRPTSVVAGTNREMTSEATREPKISIDLMAPPEKDGFFNFDQKTQQASDGETIHGGKMPPAEREQVSEARPASVAGIDLEKPWEEEFQAKKMPGEERGLDLQLDLARPDADGSASVAADGDVKFHLDRQLSAPKTTKMEIKQEKPAMPLPPPSSMPLPVAMGGWPPGSFPPFSYMGQVPQIPAAAAAAAAAGVVPFDSNAGSSNSIQPRLFLSVLPKRCGTHCYVAQQIQNHQRAMKVMWQMPTPSSAAIYGAAKSPPFNLGMMPPPPEAAAAAAAAAAFLGNPMQAGYPSRALPGGTQDAKGPSAGMAANSAKEKIAPEQPSNQMKQVMAPQGPQSAPVPNMLHAPAFIFPMSPQQAAAAAAVAAAAASANGPGTAKPNMGSNSSAPPPGIGTAGGAHGPPMNMSFAALPPNEAQFLAILHGGAYPFPIPGGAAAYRGATPQVIPFFNTPFYPLHPSQLQAQQLPQPSPASMSGQNQSVQKSSVPPASQKHLQPQMLGIPGFAGTGGTSGNLWPSNHSVEGDVEKRTDDIPTSTDANKMFQKAQKNAYDNNLENFAVMTSSGAVHVVGPGGSVDGPGDKKSSDQQHGRSHGTKVDLSLASQPLTVPFTSFGGPGVPPGSFDFSAVPPNLAFFQGHEAMRRGYPPMSMSTAATFQPAPPKAGSQHHPSGDSKYATVESAGDDDRKVSQQKFPGGASQHSLSFSKTESDSPVGPILDGVVDGTSRTLTNKSHPSVVAPAAASSPPMLGDRQLRQQHHQQQQQYLKQQLQQQQQQQQQILLTSRQKSSAASGGSPAAYTDRVTTTAGNPSKFPQNLMGFPQSNVTGQSQQQKAPPAKAPNPSPSVLSSTMKNAHLLPPQQGKASSPAITPSSRQTQISFGMSALRPVVGGAADLSQSSAAGVASVSPSSSVSKGTVSSPTTSLSTKHGSGAAILPAPSPQLSKSSASSSVSKSPAMVHQSNFPSILGQLNASSAASAGNRLQQQPPFVQAQLFFSNTYPQQPQSHSTAAASTANAAYYHKRPQDKSSSQQQSFSQGSTSMLALGPSGGMSATTAINSNNPKGIRPASALLPAPHITAPSQGPSGTVHQHMPASFPYMSMQPITVKQATDQKPTAG